MYSGRYISPRDTPQPPYLLIQQNRCQTLNTHAQQVYSSPINEQMRSMTSNNQGANFQFQRMVLQSQKIYSIFPKPSRSTISNHPSGFRTISQRRLMHQRQMLESNCNESSNMFVNQFELNNNTPAAEGGIYNDNIQPGLSVARTDNIKPLLSFEKFERLTQQHINENDPAQTCNNTLYRSAMNERMKSAVTNQLSDQSINTRTDNIKPLLPLGEFERLTQQHINENDPARTCNNTLYRCAMNERMKSVPTNQLSHDSINTRTRTMDIINNKLNHNYANVSSLDDHTYSHQNPENLSCEDENMYLPAFYTNCQNTSSYQPFGIPERQSRLLGTTQDPKSSKSCTCLSKPKKRKKRKKKSAEDPSLLQSALKDVTNNETADNEDKNAKIHPPKQQTVKPFIQSSCVNGQDTVVTCTEQIAKLDYLHALQQCQKDTYSLQCSTEKSSCNNEANAIIQNESLLHDSKNVGCKSSLKKMQNVSSQYPPKSQNCNCENQKESANIIDQHNVEEQTGSLNKEKSYILKCAHMLANALIMLNGRKKKMNKNKNKSSENLKTDPKCSSDNNISMENGTTIQDRGHPAQLSKSTENCPMSTLYKEIINDEFNDLTERTKVEEGKIKGHSHQTRIEQTTVSSNLKSNGSNILQCVFESKNNLKLYGQDGNQDSEDTCQFVTKQKESECSINMDHTSVKKFEKRGPAEGEYKIKDYAVNNLKPFDFDLDLQCIDKGDHYRKEIDAMRVNMNNQKVNSLNNIVNSEEQENNEKINSLDNNVNSDEQENNEKINSLNNNVNSDEQENNEKINSLNDVNSDEQENNEKINSLNNDVNCDEQEKNEKINSLNNNVNCDEQENNEKINSLNNNVNSDEQENNEKINSLNNDVNCDEQENNEKINSLNNNVNSDEQENNEKINSLDNNVNSDEQETYDISRWNQGCDTCRTPHSQLSAKGKTTGNNDFSFLELGYCPIVLPLGCHEYEEDTDSLKDVNNNDSPETSVNDEDCVFRNKLMVKLCDEKYNHDKTEILRPWIIQYLDEIPKPTVWKDFLETMDVENGAILDECDKQVFVDTIASPDVEEEIGQVEVTCLWNEKIESPSNTPSENVSVSPKSQMDKDTNLYKTRETSENLLLQKTTSVKKMNSSSLSKGRLEKKENYVGPTETAKDNINTVKCTGIVNVNVLPSECTENSDDLFIQNDITEKYDHEEAGRHIDNNLMKIKTTKKGNENDLNLPEVENKQIEKVRTNERKRGKKQSTDCKLIEEAMQFIFGGKSKDNSTITMTEYFMKESFTTRQEPMDKKPSDKKCLLENKGTKRKRSPKIQTLKEGETQILDDLKSKKKNRYSNRIIEKKLCKLSMTELKNKTNIEPYHERSKKYILSEPKLDKICSSKQKIERNTGPGQENEMKTDCRFHVGIGAVSDLSKDNSSMSELKQNNEIGCQPEKSHHLILDQMKTNRNYVIAESKHSKDGSSPISESKDGSSSISESKDGSSPISESKDGSSPISESKHSEDESSPISESKHSKDGSSPISESKHSKDGSSPISESKHSKDGSSPISESKHSEDESSPISESKHSKDGSSPISESKHSKDGSSPISESKHSKDGSSPISESKHSKDGSSPISESKHSKDGSSPISESKHSKDGSRPISENKHIKDGSSPISESKDGSSPISESKHSKDGSSPISDILDKSKFDRNEVRQSDENYLPKMMTILNEVEINGQAARKSDISQKESEALTGLLILRNGHMCDNINDMSNRNGYDFYCVNDISGIHGNTCDSRNDKLVGSKQECLSIDDMSGENSNNYDSRNCSVIEISEVKTFETQTTYTCSISDINISNTQTTCSSEKEIDVNFSATQFSEDVFDEPICSMQKETELGISSLNKDDQELNSNTQTVNVDGERNDSNTLYTASMSNQTISRANNTDTENVCPIKPPFSSMEIDVEEPIVFNDITQSQNKNKSGQKRNFEDVEKHIQKMLQEVRKKFRSNNLVKNQQRNASTVMSHVTVRGNTVTNTSFVQTPLVKENPVTNTSFVRTPLVKENPFTNTSFVQTPLVKENPVTNTSFVRTPLVKENPFTNTSFVQTLLVKENPVTNTSFVQTPLVKENPVTNTSFVRTPLVKENPFTNTSFVQTPLVKENPVTNVSFVQTPLVDESSVTNTSFVQTLLVKENPVTNVAFVQTPLVKENPVTNVSFVQTPLVDESSVTNTSFVQTSLVEENSKSDWVIQDQNTTSCLSAEEDDDDGDDTTPTVVKPRQTENTSGKWLIPILERLNIDILKATVFVTKSPGNLYSRHQDTRRPNAVSEANCFDAYTGNHNSADNTVVQDCRNIVSVVDSDMISSAVKKLRKRMRLKLSPSTRETNKRNESSNAESYISAPITRNKTAQLSKQSNKSPIGEKESDSSSSKVKFISNERKKALIQKQKFDKEASEPKGKICSTNNGHEHDDGDQTSLDKSKPVKITKSKAKAKNDTETMATRKRKFVFDKETNEFENDISKKRSRSMKITKDSNEIVQCKQTAKGKLNPDKTDEAKVKIQDNNGMISKSETGSEEKWNPVNIKRKKKLNSKKNTEAIIETIPSEQSEKNGISLNCESHWNKKGIKKTRPRIEKNSKQIMKPTTKSGKKKIEPNMKALKKISELNMAKSKPLNDGKVTFRLVTEPTEQKILKLKAGAFKKLHAVKICGFCHMTVPRRKYAYHVKVHHPYTCAKCSLLFSTKKEKLSHRREKHLIEIYHCITCDNVFDRRWCYEKHITSSKHRNVREIYRRGVDMMRSCLGLSVDSASRGLMMLTDGHNSTTDDSTCSQDAAILKGQVSSLLLNTEDVSFSKHEPEVQKLLKDLSGIKSHMLSCNAADVSFPIIDMEKNQSAFYNYNTVSELLSQNYASIYTSDNTQFSDLNVSYSDNFPMITQNSFNSSSENCQFISCMNSVAIETYSSSSSTLDLDESCFHECFENSDDQSELNMVDFSQTATECNNSPTKGLISEVFHLLETDGYFDCDQFKSLDVERNVDLSNIDISNEFGKNKQSTDLWKDVNNVQNNVCNESTVNYSLLDISQKATTPDINTFPQEDGNRYFNFDNMQGRPNISSRLALANINVASENCHVQNLVSENCHVQNLVSENCHVQNLVSENCYFQNLVSENCHVQNLVSENCRSQNIVSDTKDSDNTHLQYHNVTQMENRLVVEAEFNAILQDIAETETASL